MGLILLSFAFFGGIWFLFFGWPPPKSRKSHTDIYDFNNFDGIVCVEFEEHALWWTCTIAIFVDDKHLPKVRRRFRTLEAAIEWADNERIKI